MDRTEAGTTWGEFERALVDLQKFLTLADRWWDENNSDRQRLSAQIALHATLQFLHHFEETAPLAKPLRRLRNALWDLDRGRSPALLKKSAKPQSLSVEDQVRRAFALAAVEILVTAGSEVSEAMRFVVKAFKGVHMGRAGAATGSAINVSRLSKWRENAAPRGPDEVSRGMVAHFMSGAPKGLTLPDARRIVDELARMAVSPDA